MSLNEGNWPEGLKKTRPRTCVLSVLERAETPLSAMDIHARIAGEGRSVSLSTVYRILELLVKKGIAIKTTVMDNDMAIYALNRYEHKHYAVCMACHKVVDLTNCPMEKFVPRIADEDFHVIGHKLELYGYCRECSARK